jgi:hypothetical protein
MLFSWDGEQVLALRETLYDAAQDTIHSGARNREKQERADEFPSENCGDERVGAVIELRIASHELPYCSPECGTKNSRVTSRGEC